jgi:pyruvate,water dikinase
MVLATELVCRLDGTPASRHGLGGKGDWLNRLVAADFDVPPSVVLSTAVYERVVRHPALRSLIASLRDDNGEEPSSTPAEAVDAAFLGVELDDDVIAAIRDAASSILAPGERCAVRSSASAEDLRGSSFAGQYSSFLDVDEAGVERAVRLVWASLWHPAPRAYRLAHGVDQSTLAMAVVLMRMVPADQAGVAFTRDPSGSRETIRVEGVRGLGEDLVSGAVTPWVELVPRTEVADARDRDGSASATSPLAVRVAALGVAVEESFGEAQDIEWALAGDRLYLLQARPITATQPSHDGFDTSTDERARWTTAGIIEMLPGVLPPLVWDVNRTMVEEAFRQLFDQLRVLPAGIDDRGGFLGRFRGRAALSLDLVETMATAMPGGSETDVEQQYFGVAAGSRDPTSKPPKRGWRGVVHDVLVARERRSGTVEAETVIEAVATVSASAPDLRKPTGAQLLAYRRRLLDLGGRVMAAELAVAAAAVAAYRRLELTLRKRLDERDAAGWAARVTGDGVRLAGRRAPDRSRSCRAVFAGPTWFEGERRDVAGETHPPSVAVDASPVGAVWEALILRLRETPNWRTTRVVTGQVVDVRLLVLRRLVEDANDLLARREAAKAALLDLGGEVRRVHLELGRRLTEEGVLGDPTDVDLLGERELTGVQTPPSPLELQRRRRWLDDRNAEPLLPQRFRGAPRVVDEHAAKGSVLHGWPAGPGRHTARARVVDDPDPAMLEKGEVLVARTTDSSWTPVFLRAGAIVVERGGPLSHAAIVARELGVPAVLNVPGAAERLVGQSNIVTVDGDEGLVIVRDGADDAG